jgi:hypothetical protein
MTYDRGIRFPFGFHLESHHSLARGSGLFRSDKPLPQPGHGRQRSDGGALRHHDTRGGTYADGGESLKLERGFPAVRWDRGHGRFAHTLLLARVQGVLRQQPLHLRVFNRRGAAAVSRSRLARAALWFDRVLFEDAFQPSVG